ncbi:Protein of unknown function (DUF2817) [Parafrankia irregularis]|uniref:Zinc carboxypeptidase n=1 Tax=Parafrankia irregularis TaxID=795642 RepID=A0A0S4QIT8_9ACTN|nr:MULTISPECIES: M14 family metallopeptidase [Parafrankia]MBE3205675.1 M14 family metallopeptidase [Parafrankia sp. CH37]CUU55425.1 Protein of unknown function (DUF2817) [Parafrankia irregularis]
MYFSTTYAEARGRLLAAAADRGGRITSLRNDTARGVGGEELFTDVVQLGPLPGPGPGPGPGLGSGPGPGGGGAALVLVSGTHGTEGFAGSACQLRFLTEFDPATALGMSVVLVHALNPFGFSHRRRVNEDNIDINRNFVDHDRRPVNEGYAALHRWLLPADWEGPAHAAADEQIFAHLAAAGERATQLAITAGQYHHPDGLFYGGAEPCWSNTTWRSIIREHLTGYDRIAYIDLHTGLGARGAAEPIFRGGEDAGAFDRARAWYGPALTDSDDGTSSSTRIGGNSARALMDELPDTELTAITLEFGTQDAITVLRALQADNWLWLHRAAAGRETAKEAGEAGEVPEEQAARIAGLVRAAFDPPDEAWRTEILDRGLAVIAAAVTGLTGMPGLTAS